jgi:hypothetical protein
MKICKQKQIWHISSIFGLKTFKKLCDICKDLRLKIPENRGGSAIKGSYRYVGDTTGSASDSITPIFFLSIMVRKTWNFIYTRSLNMVVITIF